MNLLIGVILTLSFSFFIGGRLPRTYAEGLSTCLSIYYLIDLAFENGNFHLKVLPDEANLILELSVILRSIRLVCTSPCRYGEVHSSLHPALMRKRTLRNDNRRASITYLALIVAFSRLRKMVGSRAFYRSSLPALLIPIIAFVIF
jgi:hypothetical protein